MPRAKKTDIIDLTNESEGDYEPTPKKQKQAGKKKEKKPPAERRLDEQGKLVRFASKPRIKTQERIARAMPGSGHRLFLIERQQIRPVGAEGGACESFQVLGATGNVYTVNVCRHSSCSCPDAAKGNVCKHRLFVMLRVLRLPEDDPRVWQKVLLTDEVNNIFATETRDQRVAPDVLASRQVRDAYKDMTSPERRAQKEKEEEAQQPKRKAIQPEDECPICTEDLEMGRGEKVTFCLDCGNNVHQACMAKWIEARQGSHEPVTCPLCRAHWKDGLNPSKKPGKNEDEACASPYVNLANVSDAHRRGDTSLHALYGDRAIWIEANQGLIGRRQAAEMWEAMQHR